MKNKVLNLYDWFLIAGVIASNVIYSVATGTLDFLGSLAGITGVLCVVLVAKGSIWNYLFGLVNVSLYAYISLLLNTVQAVSGVQNHLLNLMLFLRLYFQ